MKDIRQSKSYANYMSSQGWTVKKISGVYCYIKKLPVLGHFIKIQRPQKITANLISTLQKKYHPFQIIIEPALPPKNLNFKLSRSPYLPTKTLHLDLTKSVKKLHDNCQKDCRYALRKTEKLKVSEVKSLEKFRAAWKRAVPFRRHVPSLKNLISLQKSFKSNSLFLITPDRSAGAIFIKTSSTAHYWQAFTSPAGRKTLVQYQILWQGILWAKKAGCQIFDFEGIYDERFPNQRWLGFTHFKKSFGAKQITYPGTFKKNRWRF